MPSNRLPITDRDALARVMDFLVAACGSQNRAAKRIGISQPTFSRVKTGAPDAIDYRTFTRLVDAFGGWMDGSGLPHAPSPFAIEGGVGWRADQDAVRERLERWDDLEVGVLGDEGMLSVRIYRHWLGSEVKRLGRRLNEVDDEGMLRVVMADRRYRDLFIRFAAKVGRPNPTPAAEDERYWLAIYRVFEPLFVSAQDTWGVELGWQELDEVRQLKAYLQAALEREALLMRRDPDLLRIALTPPRMSEAQWLEATLGGNEDWPRPWEPKEDWSSLSPSTDKDDDVDGV
jgi:hypothetical protein